VLLFAAKVRLHNNEKYVMLKDLKYLSAYIVPASAFAAISCGGMYTWLTVVVVFGILPVIEMLLPFSTANIAEEDESDRSKSRFFSLLLYFNIPLVYAAIIWGAWTAQNNTMFWWEWLGLVLSVGIVMGANGINVAHELGHRQNKTEQLLAKILLLPALYQHFFIEHNRGHHKHVATPEDPASAPLGQSVYFFWIKSVTLSWWNAWKLESSRLKKNGLSPFSLHNEMLVFQILQILWLAGIYAIIGPAACVFALMAGIVGFLLLETVNYIEHYGLRRHQLPGGHYEPVSPRHSWNSNHELGRIFLYELTRHSDHHYKSTRKYQILRHLDESPQLPLGYPASMLLSLIPPLWFWKMDTLAMSYKR